MIRPRFVVWLFCLIGVFIANQLIDHVFVLIFMVFLLILPLLSWLYTFRLKRQLALTFSVNDEVVERKEIAQWQISLTNRSRLQTLFLRLLVKANSINYDQPAMKARILLPQRSSQTIRIQVPAKHCGPLQAGQLSIYVRDVFGFFSFTLFSSSAEKFPVISVLPLRRVNEQDSDNLNDLLEAGEFPAGKSEVLLDEIDRMRQMVPGDRLKDIHWKLSARMQEWMVRQFEKSDENMITVLLDLPEVFFRTFSAESERVLNLRDLMLDVAYSGMEAFLLQEAKVRLKTYCPDLIVQDAMHVQGADLLRKQLALIPYRHDISFSDQLADESEGNQLEILYLLTYQLNDTFVTELKVLRSRVRGLHVELVLSDRELAKTYAKQIRQLRDFDISLHVSALAAGGRHAS